MIKPILFNTDMVRAILAGRKTQTRRIIKPQPVWSDCGMRWTTKGCWWREGWNPMESLTPKEIPIKKGDILWVRETWRPAKRAMHGYIGGRLVESSDWHDGFEYKDGFCHFPDDFDEREGDEFHLSETRITGKWHPSIHMPKEAARIFLRVKDVRVEKLQSIGTADAIEEGFCGTPCDHGSSDPVNGCVKCINTGWIEPPYAEFAQFWDTTINPADIDEYGWEANPWVWVIEFERCEKPKGWSNA